LGWVLKFFGTADMCSETEFWWTQFQTVRQIITLVN